MIATTDGPTSPPPAATGPASPHPIRAAVGRFTQHRLACVGLGFLVLLCLVAVFAPWLSPHDPDKQILTSRLQAPGGDHLLGTDQLGRDALSRLIYGSRVSLTAAAQVIVVSGVIGIPLGMVAGYVGGRLDRVLDRVNDGLMSIPGLILALSIVATLGPGLRNAMVAVGVVFAPRFFRVMRAVTQEVRAETYIEASEAIGCSTRRTIFRHVLPNTVSVLVIQASVILGTAVNAEASLSFVGLGVQPPTASWGSMLSSAVGSGPRGTHLLWPPGIMIVLTVLAFTLIGDGLRVAFGRPTSKVRTEEEP